MISLVSELICDSGQEWVELDHLAALQRLVVARKSERLSW